jgi:hypothetical protein
MIVGGYAVIFHGYGRTTGDLDIWVSSSPENKKKIIAAFIKMNYNDEAINFLKDINFDEPFDFKIGNDPIIVDVFNSITGVKYEDAIKNSIPYKFSDTAEARFIHLNDLIVNKMLTGRLKDKADVEELQRIMKYMPGKKK